MPVCLLILIGLPGSGKTFLVHNLRATLAKKYCITHVEYDAVVPLERQASIQAARAGGELEGEWKALRRLIEAAVEEVVIAHASGVRDGALTGGVTDISHKGQRAASSASLARLQPLDADLGAEDHSTNASSLDSITSMLSKNTELAPDTPHVLIIDDNMYLRSMRYRYYQLARRCRLGFCQAFLDTPEATCVRRNRDRTQQVPPEAISGMATRLERPDPVSRLWESSSISLCPGDDPLPPVEALVSAALAAPAEPLIDNALETEQSRRVCCTSQLHQLDVLTRKLVKEQVGGGAERRTRAQVANAARQSLLRRVRSGEVGLDVGPTETEVFTEVVTRLFMVEMERARTEKQPAVPTL